MSIDYYIFAFDGSEPGTPGPQPAETYPALGDPVAVRENISRYAPAVQWAQDEPYLGLAVSNEYLVELRCQPEADGLVRCIGVSSHGTADAVNLIRQFCVPLRWFVHDPQLGQWLRPDQPTTAESK